jgi:uncharacterized membrane protein
VGREWQLQKHSNTVPGKTLVSMCVVMVEQPVSRVCLMQIAFFFLWMGKNDSVHDLVDIHFLSVVILDEVSYMGNSLPIMSHHLTWLL